MKKTEKTEKTILLVEDEVLLAMDESYTLQDYGYQVIIAHTGEEAIEKTESLQNIDLILMDIDLGSGIDGTEAAAKILEKHSIPIIFLSFHQEKDIVEKTEGITSYGYILKSSPETVLIAGIKMAFRLHEAKMREKKISLEKARVAQEWQNTFDSSSDAIWILDKNQKIIRVNKTAVSFFAQDSSEMLGKKCHEIVHNTPEPIPLCPFTKTLKSLKREEIELQIEDKYFQVIVDPITNSQNQFIGAVHTIRDISYQKQAQKALLESENRYRTIFDSTGTVTLLVNNNTYIEMANKETKNVTGFSAEELIGTKWTDHVAPESLKMMQQYHKIRRINPEKVPQKYEVDLIHKSGEIRRTLLTIGMIPNSQLSIVTLIDITKRYRATQKLRENETKMTSIFLAAPIGIGLVSNRHLMDVNEYLCKLLSYTKEELIGKDSRILYPSDEDYEYVGREKYRQIQDHGSGTVETRFITKEGTILDILLTSTPLDRKDLSVGVTFTALDISEQKRVQAEIQLLAHSLKSINECVSITDLENKLIFVNDSFLKTYGYNKDELIGQNISLINSSKNAPEMFNKIRLATSKGGWSGELWNKRKDGTDFQINLSTKNIYDKENRPFALIGVAKDITQKKAAEKSLRESEEKYRRITDNVSDVVWITDLEMNPTYISPSVERVLGIKPQDYLKLPLTKTYPPASFEKFQKRLAEEFAKENDPKANKNRIFQLEVERYYSDGSIGWDAISASFIRDQQDQPVAIQGVSRDITEAKQAEKRLKESELRFRKLFEESSDAILLINKDGVFEEFNQAALDLLKMTKEQFLNRTPDDISPEFQPNGELSKESAKEKIELAYKNGLHRFDWTHLNADGEEFIVEISLMPVVVKGKTMLHTTWRDITDRKNIENELEEKTSFLSMIMETSPVGIVTVDKLGNITYANTRATQILGLEKKEITTNSYDAPLWHHTDLDGSPLPDEKQPFNIVKKSLKTALDIQHGITWPDGSVVILSINATPIIDDNAAFNGMIATIEDITERKQNEEDFKQLLQEKETLLKEVHHRVKNNISVVQSMLALQAINVEDKYCKSALQEAAGRLQSMLLLYNKLYRSEIKRNQSLQDFLPPLIKEIVDIFEKVVTIQPQLQIADITLDSKILVPLGIILNECITNSVKYSFNESKGGTVIINATQENDAVKITYSDGTDMVDPELFARSETFGLKLIQLMIKQIRGSIRIEKTDLTKYVIEFSI